MSNCDFGSPCDCRECRTAQRTEVCPMCAFENVVEIEGTAHFFVNRKGMRDVDYTYPEGPPMDLTCRKCGHTILGVAYFTQVAESVCDAHLQRNRVAATATPCSNCAEKVRYSFEGYRPIELTNYRMQRLCSKCLAKAVYADTPDPSDDFRKYVFSQNTLRWELSKIRMCCMECGKARWLNAVNAWKTRCISCYRAK